MRFPVQAFACCFILLAACAFVRAADDDKSTLTKVGDAVPKFSVQTTDGQTVTADSLKGKVVLLNFFATWCGPCNAEMPELQKLAEKYKDNKSFVLISVGREHSIEEVKKFAEDKKLTFTFAADPKRDAYKLFATQFIPRSYVIDRAGKIAFQTIGFDPTELPATTEAIDKALAAQRDGLGGGFRSREVSMVISSAKRSPERSRFLDLAALAAVAHTRFVTRHQIQGSYSGRHRSRQHGGAAEFVDFREYSAGEDLRRLDWKVLARTGRPYVRLYQDEVNLNCQLVIDASNSMSFGGKLEYVQYLATAISHVIERQQDQVGLAAIGEKLVDVLPPSGTRTHVLRLQEAIEKLSPQPRTQLAEPLRELFMRINRRGVMVMMSDFLVDDLEKLFASLRLFRHRRWEVILLHIVHPDEEHLPDGLAFQFDGLEGEGEVNCTPADVRRIYEQRFEEHAGNVRRLALAAACDYRRVSTRESYLQTLGQFLVERSG